MHPRTMDPYFQVLPFGDTASIIGDVLGPNLFKNAHFEDGVETKLWESGGRDDPFESWESSS
jgi:hypothetical protein